MPYNSGVANIRETPAIGAGTAAQRLVLIEGVLWANLTDPANPFFERYDGNAWIPFTASSPTLPAWSLAGNTLTGGEKLGSTAGGVVRVYSDNVNGLDIFPTGNVGVGTLGIAQAFKLYVAGTLRTTGNLSVATGGLGTNTLNGSLNDFIANTNQFAGRITFVSQSGANNAIMFSNPVVNGGVDFKTISMSGETFTRTSGSNSDGLLNLSPTINISGGTHSFIGIQFNPTLTSVAGLTAGLIAMALYSGNVFICINSGRFAFGTVTPDAGTAFQIDSTAGFFKGPRMTTAQRDAITALAGDQVYNTTTNKLQCYDGAVWNDLF